MNEFADLPLDQLHSHPKNPRHSAIADDEMVASIRSVGILQNLTVVPRPGDDGYWIIAGHCRKDGAGRAGLSTVPCTIRTDLDTEAQQVEAMLVENGRRRDLTAVEEAEGYQQLELFGYKAKDIAKATGRAVATVKSRLRLNDLTTGSRERLHDGQITLGDAEALLEFADDHETLAVLEEHLGTSNFRYRVQQARDGKARRERHQKMCADFEADGLSLVEYTRWDHENGPVPITWTNRGADDHPVECLGYIKARDNWSDPLLVCTDPAAHRDDDQETAAEEDRGALEAEYEARRVARDAARAADIAAAKVRIDFLVDHFTGLLAADPLSPALIETLRHTLPIVLLSENGFDFEAYMHASGLTAEGMVGWYAHSDEHVATVRAMKPAALVRTLAAVQAAQFEMALFDITFPGCVEAWDWLQSTGYTFSDVDAALHAEALANTDRDSAA